MRLRKSYRYLLLAMICLSGWVLYLLHANFMSAMETHVDSEANRAHTASIPDWLVEDVRSRLAPEMQKLVVENGISYSQIQLDKSETGKSNEPELAVIANTGHRNGIFLLYAYKDGRYEAVFEMKQPVIGFQVIGREEKMVVLTTETSGGKKDEDSLYVIRSTSNGYKVVWSGIGHSRTENETIETIEGNLQLDDEKNLIYLQLRRTLEPTGVPIMEQSSAKLFWYNEKKQHFEPK
ncbi:hypothetical protein [Brevibacillus migulae]|uniref:hypothetical protein n=1 Tax=Brevibacillus migulae TaxID=1644114 RepID=UPI00106E25EA|nr:hypothetical protein [Brevibacillus migulae]